MGAAAGDHEPDEEDLREEELFAGDTDAEWSDGDSPGAPPKMLASLPASSSAGPAAHPGVQRPGWQKVRLQERLLAMRLIHGRGPK